MLNPFTSPLDWMMSKTVLVPISAVKRFIKTPSQGHCEALDGPVPNWKRTAAVMSVVT